MENIVKQIIEHHPGQKIVILASKPETVRQLREYEGFANLKSEIQVATPLELALEILEPDINLRGLKLIPNEVIIDLLGETTASLDERGELSCFGGSHHIASLLPSIYENIIKMRNSALGEQVLAAEWGYDSSSLLGRIRNEYELNMEAWGYFDEAAAFGQAAAILEAGIIDGSGRIIIATPKTGLEPVAVNFLKALMSRGCQKAYHVDWLIPINNSSL